MVHTLGQEQGGGLPALFVTKLSTVGSFFLFDLICYVQTAKTFISSPDDSTRECTVSPWSHNPFSQL